MLRLKDLTCHACRILGFLSSMLLLLSFSPPAVPHGEIGGESHPRLFSSPDTRDIHPDRIIRVEDQKAFDNLQKSLNSALAEGNKRIEVRFSPGQYVFGTRQVLLEKQVRPDVSIRFVGNDCILLPKGESVHVGQTRATPLDYRYSYMTADGKDVNIWSPFYQTDALIQVVDEKEKLCCIHVPSSCPVGLQFSDNAYIQYTEWYYSRVCKIEQVRDSYVYFKVPELFKVRDTYNVNYDYRWHKIMPRFRFFDGKTDLKKTAIGPKSFHEGRVGTFCRILDSKFKSISFEGFRVYGGCSDNPVFFVTNSVFADYLLLYGCQFAGQRGRVAYVCKTNNAFVQRCRFYEQYTNVLVFDAYCVHSEVHGNEFENCGLDMSISMCIRCSGQDYLISGNTIVDFGYKAIAVGLGYKSNRSVRSRGVVEDNAIYYTEEYVKNIIQHGLIDSGAISVGTINENTVIRYNFINNIVGIGSNRGIYCDDGAKNFTLYGNIVLNVANSRCLDARYDTVLEKYDNTQIANVNKVMKDNIINGGVLIQGRPSANNGCMKGRHYLLYKEGESFGFDMVVKDVEKVEDDVPLPYKTTRDNAIVVSRKTRRELRKLPFYKRIEKYITVR